MLLYHDCRNVDRNADSGLPCQSVLGLNFPFVIGRHPVFQRSLAGRRYMMQATCQQTTQMRGGFLTSVALLLVTSIGANAASSVNPWSGTLVNSFGEELVTPQTESLALGDHTLYHSDPLYQQSGITAQGMSAPHNFYMLEPRKPASQLPSQILSLDDLPVDTEDRGSASQGSIAGLVPKSKKERKSLLSTILNFVKNPSVTKLLILAVTIVASYFLIGVLSRIAQVIFSIWVALKVLQLFDDHSEVS